MCREGAQNSLRNLGIKELWFILFIAQGVPCLRSALPWFTLDVLNHTEGCRCFRPWSLSGSRLWSSRPLLCRSKAFLPQSMCIRSLCFPIMASPLPLAADFY